MLIIELIILAKSFGDLLSDTEDETKATVIIDSNSLKNSGVEIIYQVGNQPPTTLTPGKVTLSFKVPFKIDIYYKTSKCEKNLYKSSEFNTAGETKTFTITLADISDECLYDKKTYQINIKNELSDHYGSQLFVQNSDGDEVEVLRDKTHTLSQEGYKPFTADVYIKTSYCEKQKIETVTATSPSTLKTYKDSNIPDVCLPFSVCIECDLTDDYSIGYKSSADESDDIIKLTENQLFLENESQFDVQLFMIKSPNCQANQPLQNLTASKNFQCKSLTINDIPKECKVLYKVCFNTSIISNEFKIGYVIDKEPESQMKELTNTPIQSITKFSVSLYLTQSPNCKENIHLNDYNAEKDFECVTLGYNDIPLGCRATYYINIISQLSEGNSLYYKERSEYNHVWDIPYTGVMPFEMDLYITTPTCSQYTYIKTVKATTDIEKVETIYDSDIVKDCQAYSFCGDFSRLSSNYEIDYTLSYEKDTPIHHLVHGEVSHYHNQPFYINYSLIKSPKCSEGEINGTIQASLFSKCLKFDDSMIPSKCWENSDQTPKPTDIPSYEEVETVKAYLDAQKYTDFNKALKEKFDSLNQPANNGKNKVVKVISNEFTFNSQLNEDQMIAIDSGTKINYQGGDLRLIAKDKVDIALNDNNAINIGFYREDQNQNQIESSLELSNANKEKEDVIVTINPLSQLNNDVIFKVPSNVKSLVIDSLTLSNKGDIGATNQNDEPVTITVNNVEIKDYGSAGLKNVEIQESLIINQLSYLSIDDVKFNESAIIKYRIHNFNSGSHIPIQGTFHEARKIEISKITNDTNTQNYQHQLLHGEFEGSSCEEWGKMIDFSNSGFDEFTCSHVNFVQSGSYSLSVNHKRGGNKGSSFPLAIVIGVVVAVVVIVVVVIVVVIVIKRKRNKKSEKEDDDIANATDI